MTIDYRVDGPVDRDALTALYTAVGWSVYTKNPAKLEAVVAASLHVVTARNDGALVGLARVVGDGLTIAYLQDILVDPTHQRLGIGRELFHRVFAPFDDVPTALRRTSGTRSRRNIKPSRGSRPQLLFGRNRPHFAWRKSLGWLYKSPLSAHRRY